MKRIKDWSDVQDYDKLTIQVRRKEYKRMSGGDRKRMGELRVFRGFANASGLAIDPSSVLSIEPPYPDISCKLSGSLYFFELAEVTDAGLAKRVNESLKTKQVTGGFYSDDEPLIKRIITSKLQKKYQTDGAPFDLLLYYWKQRPHQDAAAVALTKLRPVFDRQTVSTPFSRIWLYHHPDQRVLSFILV